MGGTYRLDLVDLGAVGFGLLPVSCLVGGEGRELFACVVEFLGLGGFAGVVLVVEVGGWVGGLIDMDMID